MNTIHRLALSIVLGTTLSVAVAEPISYAISNPTVAPDETSNINLGAALNLTNGTRYDDLNLQINFSTADDTSMFYDTSQTLDHETSSCLFGCTYYDYYNVYHYYEPTSGFPSVSVQINDASALLYSAPSITLSETFRGTGGPVKIGADTYAYYSYYDEIHTPSKTFFLSDDLSSDQLATLQLSGMIDLAFDFFGPRASVDSIIVTGDYSEVTTPLAVPEASLGSLLAIGSISLFLARTSFSRRRRSYAIGKRQSSGPFQGRVALDAAWMGVREPMHTLRGRHGAGRRYF